jgi:hypothetical protein
VFARVIVLIIIIMLVIVIVINILPFYVKQVEDAICRRLQSETAALREQAARNYAMAVQTEAGSDVKLQVEEGVSRQQLEFNVLFVALVVWLSVIGISVSGAIMWLVARWVLPRVERANRALKVARAEQRRAEVYARNMWQYCHEAEQRFRNAR